MRDAIVVEQSHAFESSSETERADLPESPRAWPLGTQPVSVAWDDDAVQVMLDDSLWHRQAVGLPETACGIKIDYRKSLGIRVSSYLGALCQRGCFSHHEIDTIAPAMQALADRQAADEQERRERHWKETFDGFREERNKNPKK